MRVVKELECEHCAQRLIELRGGPDNTNMLINWHASPAGNIVIKGDKATVLRSADRARKLLEVAGVPDADRYIVHVCWRKPRRAKRR